MSATYTNEELYEMAQMDNEEGRIAADLLRSRGVEEL